MAILIAIITQHYQMGEEFCSQRRTRIVKKISLIKDGVCVGLPFVDWVREWSKTSQCLTTIWSLNSPIQTKPAAKAFYVGVGILWWKTSLQSDPQWLLSSCQIWAIEARLWCLSMLILETRCQCITASIINLPVNVYATKICFADQKKKKLSLLIVIYGTHLLL